MPQTRRDQMGAVLTGLADTEDKRRMSRGLMEGMRNRSPFLPADETMPEFLRISFAPMDGDYRLHTRERETAPPHSHSMVPGGLEVTS